MIDHLELKSSQYMIKMAVSCENCNGPCMKLTELSSQIRSLISGIDDNSFSGNVIHKDITINSHLSYSKLFQKHGGFFFHEIVFKTLAASFWEIFVGRLTICFAICSARGHEPGT